MKSVRGSVAASVDAPIELFPVLADVFAGMPSLGSSPRVVARLLREAGVGPGSRVLDLACGKGTAGVEAAVSLRCRVHGVDGYGPFVEAGRGLAARRAVSKLVTFEQADLAQWTCSRRFDAAMMLGLWAIDRARDVLRPCVKRGGVYLVDDVYFDPERGRVPRGLERPPTLEDARGVLEGLGDEVESVECPSPAAVRRTNARLLARLTENTGRLGRERPSLKGALREFVRRQRAANQVLDGAFRPAVWVVRRA